MNNNFRAKVFYCLNSFVMTGDKRLRKDEENVMTHQNARTENLPLVMRLLPAFSIVS